MITVPPNGQAAASPAGASRLQSLRPAGWVAELGSFADMNLIRWLFALLALGLWSQAQEISSKVSVQTQTVGRNADQKYFLIEHKGGTETGKARGLILILPGGPGSADFLPFCANVLTLYGIPADFVAAELVAPQWSTNEDRVVWPSRAFPDRHSKFTSDEFLGAVT